MLNDLVIDYSPTLLGRATSSWRLSLGVGGVVEVGGRLNTCLNIWIIWWPRLTHFNRSLVWLPGSFIQLCWAEIHTGLVCLPADSLGFRNPLPGICSITKFPYILKVQIYGNKCLKWILFLSPPHSHLRGHETLLAHQIRRGLWSVLDPSVGSQ